MGLGWTWVKVGLGPHVPASSNSAAYLIIEGGLLKSEDYLCSWLNIAFNKNDIERVSQTNTSDMPNFNL